MGILSKQSQLALGEVGLRENHRHIGAISDKGTILRLREKLTIFELYF